LAGGAYSAPPDPLAGFRGATSKAGGEGREEKGEEGEGRKWEGSGREGRERGADGRGGVDPPSFC